MRHSCATSLVVVLSLTFRDAPRERPTAEAKVTFSSAARPLRTLREVARDHAGGGKDQGVAVESSATGLLGSLCRAVAPTPSRRPFGEHLLGLSPERGGPIPARRRRTHLQGEIGECPSLYAEPEWSSPIS